MLRSRFEQVMVRAVLDLPFRARLLSDPAKVLVDYGMKPTDAYLFAELHTQSLEELAGQLLRIGLEKWGIRVPGVGTYWDDGIDVFTYRAIVTRSQDIYPIPTCFVHLM